MEEVGGRSLGGGRGPWVWEPRRGLLGEMEWVTGAEHAYSYTVCGGFGKKEELQKAEVSSLNKRR